MGPSFDEPPALGWDVPVDMEPGGEPEADHQLVPPVDHPPDSLWATVGPGSFAQLELASEFEETIRDCVSDVLTEDTLLVLAQSPLPDWPQVHPDVVCLEEFLLLHHRTEGVQEEISEVNRGVDKDPDDGFISDPYRLLQIEDRFLFHDHALFLTVDRNFVNTVKSTPRYFAMVSATSREGVRSPEKIRLTWLTEIPVPLATSLRLRFAKSAIVLTLCCRRGLRCCLVSVLFITYPTYQPQSKIVKNFS